MYPAIVLLLGAVSVAADRIRSVETDVFPSGIVISRSQCPSRCECEQTSESEKGTTISVFCREGVLDQSELSKILRQVPEGVTVLDIEAPKEKPNQLLWDDNLNRFSALRSLCLVNSGIPAISRSLRLPNLEILDLRNNHIEHLSISMFAGVPSVRELNIAGNLLSVLPTGAFTYLRNLKTLDLSNNNITELSANLLRGLNKLKVLNLSGNKIAADQMNNLIADVGQLEQLELNYCSLDGIESIAFERLKSLNRLGLAGNKLNVIPSLHLRGLNSLSNLDLSDNSIRTIPPFSFASSPISRISLAHNRLGESPFALKSESFAMMHLVELDLSYNNLDLFESSLVIVAQNTLEVLHLTGNNLEQFHERLTKNLTSLRALHLAHNNIKYIPSILPSEYSKLIFLNLSKNYLNELPDNSRLILPSLEQLDISQNEFTTFSMSVLHEFINDLDEVYLNDNPWNCGCVVDELKRHMLERYALRWSLNYERTRCASPPELKGTIIYRLNHIADCAVLFGARYGLSQASELTILFTTLVTIAIFASLLIFFIYYRREHKMKAKYKDEGISQSRVMLTPPHQTNEVRNLITEPLTSSEDSSLQRSPIGLPPPPPPILATF